ncbi:VWA domain-containing protein (plasmid) [Paroceanicella profunda]|uniref:VWA domain-containing protein n=1 Tax=Paroceanicella profunda TaxID=2579971 RepID=A0A5B8FIR2_9RHOB|nr:VWA domain-containing protein [Paroceanicella profunda]QDL94091.1 VWA domain-containing protein [Paroceanicella profunda]
MSFAASWLLLLLPLPLLALLLPQRPLRRAALALPPAFAAQARPAVPKGPARHLPRAALWLAWGCALLALAGPRQLETIDALPASGRDIVLALDLSGSMEREDFELDGARVSRLAAVQAVAAQFVRGRDGDRVGLVVFGARAYVAAAPTHDVAAVAQAIETAMIGVSGRATAIADGLGLAIRRLRGRAADSRVILLLSDGQDTSGAVDPVAAAGAAAALGIRIHTIALGPRDLEGAPDSRDAVDTATLRRIAQAAGGVMFRVRSTADLRAVAEAIDRLEPSAADAPPIRGWRPLWVWPGALALLLLGVPLLLRRGEVA